MSKAICPFRRCAIALSSSSSEPSTAVATSLDAALRRAGQLLRLGGRERAPCPFPRIRRQRRGALEKGCRGGDAAASAVHGRPSAPARRRRPRPVPAWRAHDATRGDQDPSRHRWPRQGRGARADGRRWQPSGRRLSGRVGVRTRRAPSRRAIRHPPQAPDMAMSRPRIPAARCSSNRSPRGSAAAVSTSSCVSLGSSRRRLAKLCSIVADDRLIGGKPESACDIGEVPGSWQLEERKRVAAALVDELFADRRVKRPVQAVQQQRAGIAVAKTADRQGRQSAQDVVAEPSTGGAHQSDPLGQNSASDERGRSAPTHRRTTARRRSGREAAADRQLRPARSAWQVRPGIGQGQVRSRARTLSPTRCVAVRGADRADPAVGHTAGAARCTRVPSPTRCRPRSRHASRYHAPQRSPAGSSCRCPASPRRTTTRLRPAYASAKTASRYSHSAPRPRSLIAPAFPPSCRRTWCCSAGRRYRDSCAVGLRVSSWDDEHEPTTPGRRRSDRSELSGVRLPSLGPSNPGIVHARLGGRVISVTGLVCRRPG